MRTGTGSYRPNRGLRHVKNHVIATFAVTAFILLWGLKIYSAAWLELLPQEAYYWTYSQHRALSYFDHPPMVAWTITLGTHLFGNSEFGVRFGSLLLSAGSLPLMFLYSRFWFGTVNAIWCSALISLLPIYLGNGFLIFPDSPLIFFWLLTLYLFSRAVRHGHTVDWALAGLSFGAAMLSKYSALFLGIGALLFLARSARHRHWLGRRQPWLALALAGAMFSPVLVWNIQHGWVSLLFQASRPIDQTPESVRYFFEFWLFQSGSVTPFILVLLLATAVCAEARAWSWKKDAWNLSTAFFWPLFGLFIICSVTTKIHINWTAPAFLSLLPAAIQFFRIIARKRQYKGCWQAIAYSAWLMCGLSVALIFSILVAGQPRSLARGHLGGWRQLTGSVQDTERKLKTETGQRPFILGVDKLYYAAEFGFYSGQPDNTVNWYALDRFGFGYTYWTDLAELHGRPAVAILSDRLAMPVLAHYFDRLDPPRKISIRYTNGTHRTFFLVKCFGYKGSQAESASRTR